MQREGKIEAGGCDLKLCFGLSWAELGWTHLL
jgi:hypothetical protein